MKSTDNDGTMPMNPNPGVTSGRDVPYNESAQRPVDPNNVTDGKSVHSGESDNRPPKP